MKFKLIFVFLGISTLSSLASAADGLPNNYEIFQTAQKACIKLAVSDAEHSSLRSYQVSESRLQPKCPGCRSIDVEASSRGAGGEKTEKCRAFVRWDWKTNSNFRATADLLRETDGGGESAR